MIYEPNEICFLLSEIRGVVESKFVSLKFIDHCNFIVRCAYMDKNNVGFFHIGPHEYI